MDDYELISMEEVGLRRYVIKVKHRGKELIFHYDDNTGKTFQEDENGRLLSCDCPTIIEKIIREAPVDEDSIVGC